MHIIRDKHKTVIAILVLTGFTVLLASCATEEVVSQNVWALGVPLGGLPFEEAVSLIESKVGEIRKGPLVFKAGEMCYEVPSEDLKIAFDTKQITTELEKYIDSRFILLPASVFRKGPKTVVSGDSGVNSPDLNDIAANIADNLSKQPVPERYGFSGHDLVIMPSEQGQTVSYEDVLASFENLEGTTVEVPFQTTQPEDSQSLEPLSLVGSFQTDYKLEETDRNVNLTLAAKAVHGKVLVPGDTYSFNEEAGERSVERGYRYANVVVGNTLVPDIGGGICQVTTTLFNAAAESGLEFPEIHAHGIPVEYVDPGLDAAVAWNYLDIKIRNDFNHPVVFGAWVEDGKVSVSVFGKPLDSTYELEPVIIEEYPEEGKNPGLLVETYRLEKQDGQVKSRQMLVRSYYLPSYPRPK